MDILSLARILVPCVKRMCYAYRCVQESFYMIHTIPYMSTLINYIRDKPKLPTVKAIRAYKYLPFSIK